jgi:hypothetical protein
VAIIKGRVHACRRWVWVCSSRVSSVCTPTGCGWDSLGIWTRFPAAVHFLLYGRAVVRSRYRGPCRLVRRLPSGVGRQDGSEEPPQVFAVGWGLDDTSEGLYVLLTVGGRMGGWGGLHAAKRRLFASLDESSASTSELRPVGGSLPLQAEPQERREFCKFRLMQNIEERQ